MKSCSSLVWIVIAILAVFVVASSLLATQDNEPYTSAFKDTGSFECGQPLAFFGGGLGLILVFMWIRSPNHMEDKTGGDKRK